MTPPPTYRPFRKVCIMFDSDEELRFPQRKSPRIPNFDYASPHYYFITICTKGKACIFGVPAKLSALGEVTRDCLLQIPAHFPTVTIDKWVVMPNHIHAIIILNGSTNLSTVIGQFKSAVTKKLHQADPTLTIWQVSYHDHIIRNEADYQRIWTYIDNNPLKWEEDCFHDPSYSYDATCSEGS